MADLYEFAEESTGLRFDALLLACMAGSAAWYAAFLAVSRLAGFAV